MRKLLAGIFLILSTVGFSAYADTIVVTTLEDIVSPSTPQPGECTLRDAILAANTDADAGACRAGNTANSIGFQKEMTGTIHLQGPLPPITSEVSITGPGADDLFITAGGATRIFEVQSGNFSISNLELSKGAARSLPNAYGGAIYIHTGSEEHLIDRVRFRSNAAQISGGALAYFGNGKLTIRDSDFISNEAFSDDQATTPTYPANGGGGVFLAIDGGTIEIERSTFESNEATGRITPTSPEATGGGLLLYVSPNPAANTSMSVKYSTFTRNLSWGDGGAISIWGPTTAVIESTTIVSNGADSNRNASGSGGGLATNAQGDAKLTNTIIVSNAALQTIVPIGVQDCSGTIGTRGYNYFGPVIFLGTTTNCASVRPTDIIGSAPGLGGLQNNGGFGKTLEPSGPQSGVFGRGICTDRKDQNDVRLPVDSACEIGAAEYKP